MDAASRIVGAIRRLPPREQAEAVRAGFRVASPSEREDLGLIAVELGARRPDVAETSRKAVIAREAADTAIEILVSEWHRTPQIVRKAAAAVGRAEWAGAIRRLERRKTPPPGRALALLVSDTCDPAAAARLGAVLARGEAEAAGPAARALLATAIRLTEPRDPLMLGLEGNETAEPPLLDPEPREWLPQDLDGLLDSVAAGVEGYGDHHRKEVLLAAILLLEHPAIPWARGGALGKQAADPDSPIGKTLAAAFRRARAPLARERAMYWMRVPTLAAACAERVSRAPSAVDHAALLGVAHLGLAPARAGALRMVPIATRPAPAEEVPWGAAYPRRRLHPQCVCPDRRTLAGLPAPLRRQASRLVGMVESDQLSRELALDPMLLDRDSVVRWIGSRVSGREAVGEYVFDQCLPIARHAALAGSAAGFGESMRLRAGDAARRSRAERLTRSPHRAIRRIAREEAERISPEGGGTLGSLAARRALAADRDGFLQRVRTAIREGDGEGRTRWLMLCRRLRIVAEIEPGLIAIVRDHLRDQDAFDGRVVATSVACLGELPAVRTASLLAEVVRRSGDARIAANAADALARIGRRGESEAVLAERTGDGRHRVRASAIRGLTMPWPEPTDKATVGAAADDLASMLIDEREAHRLAGVWVVQRSLGAGLAGRVGARWAEIASRVRWLAEGESEERIRVRAADACRRLGAARGAAVLPGGRSV